MAADLKHVQDKILQLARGVNSGHAVKLHGDLYDAGLDSLQQVELVMAAEKAFHVEISDKAAEKAGTAAGLARLVVRALIAKEAKPKRAVKEDAESAEGSWKGLRLTEAAADGKCYQCRAGSCGPGDKCPECGAPQPAMKPKKENAAMKISDAAAAVVEAAHLSDHPFGRDELAPLLANPGQGHADPLVDLALKDLVQAICAEAFQHGSRIQESAGMSGADTSAMLGRSASLARRYATNAKDTRVAASYVNKAEQLERKARELQAAAK